MTHGSRDSQSILSALLNGDDMLPSVNDGMLFAQLMMGSGARDNVENGHDGASGLSHSRSGDMTRLINHFTTSLVPQLQSATQEALEVSIHLPRLGRIRINTQRDPSGWDMTLHAEDHEARHLLSQHQSHCESALHQALGQRVTLNISDEAPA